MQQNRFAAAQFDDSDDEHVVQNKTKTQVKKEDRKITEKRPKANAAQMETGGFEVVSKNPQQAAPARGGKAAARGGRGGAHGRGGRGGARPVRLDADGNKVGAGSNNRERRPFTGKPREEAHPMDRRDGTGRGRRPAKKDGHGKGNVGQAEDVAYVKKTDQQEDAPVEEQKEAKPEEPKTVVKTEVIGISMDDFFANKQKVGRKEGRQAEGISGAKVEANAAEKVRQQTVQQNQYQKGSVATVADAQVAQLTGFGSVNYDDEQDNRRGPRQGNQQAQRGGRRVNAKQALKRTEEDFPTL